MSIPLQYQLFFLMLDKFSNVKHCLIPKNILLNFQEKIILKINSKKNDTLIKLIKTIKINKTTTINLIFLQLNPHKGNKPRK